MSVIEEALVDAMRGQVLQSLRSGDISKLRCPDGYLGRPAGVIEIESPIQETNCTGRFSILHELGRDGFGVVFLEGVRSDFRFMNGGGGGGQIRFSVYEWRGWRGQIRFSVEGPFPCKIG
jgi:hypothetical protein